jgi:cell wall-associated NlpC family hydrolase
MLALGVKNVGLMLNQYKSIIKSKAKIHSSPSNSSNLETEGLFGEIFEIKKIEGEWTFGKLLTDNYEGWIKTKKIGNQINPTHKVSVSKTHIYNLPDSKALSIMPISLGSRVNVIKDNGIWVEVLIDSYKSNKGYVPSSHLNPISYIVSDWVTTAERFIGSPYVWGGRSIFGIDCSGLVQISLNSVGIKIPRNSSQQFKVLNEKNSSNFSYKRGDLVYWKGHIAILKNKTEIIHANGFHMCVNIESLENIYSRIGKGIFLSVK